MVVVLDLKTPGKVDIALGRNNVLIIEAIVEVLWPQLAIIQRVQSFSLPSLIHILTLISLKCAVKNHLGPDCVRHY